MNRMIRVMLVDDHTLLRTPLEERLGREPDLQVVGSVESAEQAVPLITQVLPDVVLLDIELPGVDGFEAARRIRALAPVTKIIFASAFVQDTYVAQAIQVKANGYLIKTEPPERVIAAIREATTGGAFFSPQVQARIVIDDSGVRLPERPVARIATLSRRELDVLIQVAQGLSNKAVGQRLHIATKTVDHHITSIMSKLDIHHRGELVRFAIREGLVQP